MQPTRIEDAILYERAACLQTIEQLGSCVGERLPVERHIDEHVCVDQDQRYFRARAS